MALINRECFMFAMVSVSTTTLSFFDNELLIKTDSIRISQINIYKDLNTSLNKSLKKKHKSLLFWKIGGITISSSFLLLFLLK